MPREVEGQGGPAVGGSEVCEVGVVLLARAGAVDHDHTRGRTGSGCRQPERVRQAAVAVLAIGEPLRALHCGDSGDLLQNPCLMAIRADSSGSVATDPIASSPVYPG